MNTRVLIVDDEELVRDSVRAILCPEAGGDYGGLEAAAERLFERGPPLTPRSSIKAMNLTLDEAAHGRAALEQVERAKAEQRPYALILLDMRMPGWDGLTTAEAIRAVDARSEVLFITAYSDHDIREVVERAGPDVGYLCKPFAAEELRQLTTKALYDWNRLHNLEALIRDLAALRVPNGELERLLQLIFDQAVVWLGARSAMLISRADVDAPAPLHAIGALEDGRLARACLDSLRDHLGADRDSFAGDAAYFPFGEYALIAHREGGFRLSRERRYLFRLFIEHGEQAVENARLHQELVAREKLSAVGQAVGYVVHDLRNPIGAITTAASILREEPGLPAGCDEWLDLIDESAKNAVALVSDVLDFTREHEPELTTCALSALFERFERGARARAAAAGIRLDIEAPADERLACDPRKLHRVLENLAGNALDALADSDTAEPRLSIRARPDGDRLILTIRDNGPGIPAPIRERLFEPFTTMGKRDGTGLGLAIVRQIIEAHGGEIEVEHGRDRGTAFHISLPRGPR